MAQELRVILWCDVHQADDEREEGRTITFNGWAMELCSKCEAEYTIKALDTLLEQYGRPAEEAPAEPRTSSGRPMCPYGCRTKSPDGGFVSERGLKRHLSMQHPEA
jgi:hypothetical protein